MIHFLVFSLVRKYSYVKRHGLYYSWKGGRKATKTRRNFLLETGLRIRIRIDLHYFGNLDPDPQSQKLGPYPQSEKRDADTDRH
jgi:hypothetical protein